MTTCTSCAGPLYGCDAGFTTCVECERAAILGRDAGMARATAAHPDDAARVDAAIRQLAARGGEFSSNDARRLHSVKGPVVGARFNAAAKAGLIRRIGYVRSTEPGTHAHPVALWSAA